MIKITFKTPQKITFKKIGEKIVDSVDVECLSIHPVYTNFSIDKIDNHVFTKSIEHVKPNEL